MTELEKAAAAFAAAWERNDEIGEPLADLIAAAIAIKVASGEVGFDLPNTIDAASCGVYCDVNGERQRRSF